MTFRKAPRRPGKDMTCRRCWGEWRLWQQRRSWHKLRCVGWQHGVRSLTPHPLAFLFFSLFPFYAFSSLPPSSCVSFLLLFHPPYFVLSFFLFFPLSTPLPPLLILSPSRNYSLSSVFIPLSLSIPLPLPIHFSLPNPPFLFLSPFLSRLLPLPPSPLSSSSPPSPFVQHSMQAPSGSLEREADKRTVGAEGLPISCADLQRLQHVSSQGRH